VGLSRGFRVFLVASALFAWILIEWQRGPAVATAGIAGIAASVIGVVAAVAVGIFLNAVVHEFGHAVPAALLTAGRPLIELGRAPRRTRFSIGRIDVHLGIRPGQAHCIPPWPQLTRRRQIVVCAGGPIASVAVAGLWILLAANLSHSPAAIALVIGLIELAHALYCLIPSEFDRPDDDGRPRTMHTDGALIAAALRNRVTVRTATPAPIPFRVSARGQAVITTMLQLACAERSGAVHTRHLLVALATADEPTRELLKAQGWSIEIGELSDQALSLPPATPALARVLDATRAAVLASDRQATEPEHLLLALLRSGDTEALGTLRDAGVDLERLRWGAIAALGGPTAAAAT
jgi:hypothetical protein